MDTYEIVRQVCINFGKSVIEWSIITYGPMVITNNAFGLLSKAMGHYYLVYTG